MQAYYKKTDMAKSVRGLDNILEKGKAFILSGKIISFPTESFYALGADATNEAAVQRLFTLKNRQYNAPVLVLIGSREQFCLYARDIPDYTDALIDAFWPGGLTLIFKARKSVSPLLTAGTGKIGIRLSSHPVPCALIRMSGVPLTGTSANLSGNPPCKTAQEVIQVFGSRVDMVVDDGQTEGKAPSTVLDLTVYPPQVLRHGMVTEDRIKAVLA